MVDDAENGKVTMAVLATKIDSLNDSVRAYCAEARDREKRLQAMERRQDVNDEQHKQIVKDAAEREKSIIEDQTRRTWAASVSAAAVGIFSAFIAFIGGGQ